nr:o-succinylbenzoic acid-CoA ligase [Cyanidiaceae sp.]
MIMNTMLRWLYFYSLKTSRNIIFASSKSVLTYREVDNFIQLLSFIFPYCNVKNNHVLVLTNNAILAIALSFSCINIDYGNYFTFLSSKVSLQTALKFIRTKNISAFITDERKSFFGLKQWLAIRSIVGNYLFSNYILTKLLKNYLLYKLLDCENVIFGFNLFNMSFISSGTTGNSKICWNHVNNYFFASAGTNKAQSFNYRARSSLLLPIFHVGGYSLLFRSIIGGGTIILFSLLKDSQLLCLSFYLSYGYYLFMVNTQFYRLLYYPLLIKFVKNGKMVVVGGSFFRWDSLTSLDRKLKLSSMFFHSYGLTEAFAQVFFVHLGSNKHYTINLPYRQSQINYDSQIIIRGRTLFKNCSIAFVKEFIKKHSQVKILSFSSALWLYTYDTVTMIYDNTLNVTGRLDNVFVRAGENISPEAIEKELNSVKNISNSFVVPVKHSELGHIIIAFISLNVCSFNTSNFTKAMANRLEANKVPERLIVFVRDSFLSGKISRKMVMRYLSS